MCAPTPTSESSAAEDARAAAEAPYLELAVSSPLAAEGGTSEPPDGATSEPPPVASHAERLDRALDALEDTLRERTARSGEALRASVRGWRRARTAAVAQAAAGLKAAIVECLGRGEGPPTRMYFW